MEFPIRASLLPVLSTLSLLTACGGGGKLDEAPKIPTVADATAAASKAGTLRTITEARRAANLMLPLLSPNSVVVTSTGKASGGEPGVQEREPGTAVPKAVTACAGGGTKTDSTSTNVDVDSPYTEERFDLTVLSYSLCRETEEREDETLTIATNGTERDGSVALEDAEAYYLQRGDSTAAPLRFSVQHQPKPGLSGPSFTVNTETFGIFHFRFSNSSAERQRQRYYVSRGEVSGSESGESFGGAFYIQQGSPSFPMIVNSPQDGGLAHEGNVSAALLAEPSDLTEACGGGSYQVVNLSPLKDLDESEGQLIQGSLQLKAGGQTATYVLSGDGRVEITAGDGSKVTINQSELRTCPILEIF